MSQPWADLHLPNRIRPPAWGLTEMRDTGQAAVKGASWHLHGRRCENRSDSSTALASKPELTQINGLNHMKSQKIAMRSCLISIKARCCQAGKAIRGADPCMEPRPQEHSPPLSVGVSLLEFRGGLPCQAPSSLPIERSMPALRRPAHYPRVAGPSWARERKERGGVAGALWKIPAIGD